MLRINNIPHPYFTWSSWVPIRWSLLANIYLFKDNNRNNGKRCEICSKLTIKTYERRQWHDIFLLSLLLTLNIYNTFFYVSFGYYEQGTVCWASSFFSSFLHGRWGLITEITVFILLYHFFVVLGMLRSSQSYLFYKRSALQNIGKIYRKPLIFTENPQKTTSATVFSCGFFAITKETFFIKPVRVTVHQLEKSL